MHISLDSALGRQRRLNSVGESVFQIAPDAAAGYSLRSLTGGDPSVVRVRRESDNGERDFRSSEINSGEMVNWVNQQVIPPLDLRTLTATGRDGPIIEAAAAYSLRNLSDSYAGSVVEVRRNTDGALKDFKASEVTDGTLAAWVNTSFANALPLDTAGAAAAAYSLRNLSSSYTGSVVEVRRPDGAVRSFTAAEVTDGTLVTWVGDAQYFNGTDAQVSMGNVLNMGTGDFHLEVEATFKSTGATQGILSKGKNASGNAGYDLRINNDGTIGFVLRTASTTTLCVGATTLTDGQRYLIRVEVTRGSVSEIYLDGVLDGTEDISGLGASSVSNTLPFYLGRTTNNSNLYQYPYTGVLTSVNINGVSAYTGLGNDPWKDTIGSNNGTPSNVGFDGTVSKWYDQSGNDKHATQGTPASQPKIVSGGSLITGGIDFDGVDDRLITGSFSLTQAFTSFSVTSTDVSSTSAGIWGIGDSESSPFEAISFYRSDDGFAINAGGTLTTASTQTYNTGRDYLKTSFFDGASSSIRVDGVTKVTATAGTTNPSGLLMLGQFISSSGSAAIRLNGKIQEIIIYDSDQSDKSRAIEENIGSTYGITLTSSKDGTVSKWYDQSTTSGTPNAKHAVQTSAASQPKIVSGGSLVTAANGLPAMRVLGNTQSLGLPQNLSFSDFSAFYVVKHQTIGTSVSWLGDNGGGDYLRYTSSAYQIRAQGVQTAFIDFDTTISSGDNYLLSAVRGSNTLKFFIDGSAQANTVSSSGIFDVQKLFRRGNNTTQTLNGFAQELILYSDDQTDNRTALEANIGEVYGIAGIPAYDNTVNGFVETWYDQSGNGNNAVQLTASKQPKIVDGGALVTGGLAFDGTSDFFQASIGTLTQPISGFSVFKNNSLLNSPVVWDSTSLTNRVVSFSVASDDTFKIFAGVSIPSASSSQVDGTTYLRSDLINTTASEGYVNGTLKMSGNPGTNSMEGLTIGARYDGSVNFINGSIAEVIIYNSDQSANRLAIEANINNQYDIY